MSGTGVLYGEPVKDPPRRAETVPPLHSRPVRRPLPLLPIALASVLVIAVTWWIDDRGTSDVMGATATSEAAGADRSTTTTTEPPYDGWSNPAKSGQPWPGATVEGLLTFRGNPTRSFYGTGPVPARSGARLPVPP